MFVWMAEEIGTVENRCQIGEGTVSVESYSKMKHCISFSGESRQRFGSAQHEFLKKLDMTIHCRQVHRCITGFVIFKGTVLIKL